MALHALAQCSARVLLAAQRGVKEELDIVRGFSELGMEERAQDMGLSVFRFLCPAFFQVNEILTEEFQRGRCGAR
jgi:hypothetical protein